MEWLIRNHGTEFNVHGFDIAPNCLGTFFAGREQDMLTVGSLWSSTDVPQGFDAVFCADVLEHIPPERVDDTLRNLRRAASKIAFLGIALFPDGFGPAVIGKPLHLTVRPAEWWIERVVTAGFSVMWAKTSASPNGSPAWLYVAALPNG